MTTAIFRRARRRTFLRVLMFVMAMPAGHLMGEEVADVGRVPDAVAAGWRKQEGITAICNCLRRKQADDAVDIARWYGLQREDSGKIGQNIEALRELRLQPDVAAAVFDTYLYGGGLQVDEAPVRQRLETILRKKISSINELCQLTDQQKEKLCLAGSGDIKRLFDRVAAQRKKFVVAADIESDTSTIELATDEMSQIRNGLNSGPFENDSLVAKVLRRHLTTKQIADYNRRRSNLSFANRKAIPEIRLAN